MYFAIFDIGPWRNDIHDLELINLLLSVEIATKGHLDHGSTSRILNPYWPMARPVQVWSVPSYQHVMLVYAAAPRNRRRE